MFYDLLIAATKCFLFSYIFLNFIGKFLWNILYYKWFQGRIFCSFPKADQFKTQIDLVKVHILEKDTNRRVAHMASS